MSFISLHLSFSLLALAWRRAHMVDLDFVAYEMGVYS
jgi:hypothetical protein